MPLTDFHREQFGGSVGGPIIKDKLFYFGAAEGIFENFQRPNLSTYNSAAVGSAPCPISNPTFRSNITDAQIDANGDCQRLVLINFYKSNFNENEGLPVNHNVKNGAFFGRMDYTFNPKNQFFGSYNFDYSRNPNQTFDVATYGTTANGIEGPAHIQTLNFNLVSTISASRLNEAHITYGHETRPRSAINSTAVPDTGIGFFPSFRFGQPFFLGPGASETFWHLQFKDNFSLILGKHTIKMGGEFIYSKNTQIFDGFALGRYIFGSTTGFLHYATASQYGQRLWSERGAVPQRRLRLHHTVRRRSFGQQSALTLSAGCSHAARRDGATGRLFRHQQQGARSSLCRTPGRSCRA